MRNSTRKRILKFMGLKLFEISAFLLIVFLSHLIGTTLHELEGYNVCNFDEVGKCVVTHESHWNYNTVCDCESNLEVVLENIGFFTLGFVVLIIGLILLGILIWILYGWIKWNWKKAGEL